MVVLFYNLENGSKWNGMGKEWPKLINQEKQRYTKEESYLLFSLSFSLFRWFSNLAGTELVDESEKERTFPRKVE